MLEKWKNHHSIFPFSALALMEISSLIVFIIKSNLIFGTNLK